MDMFIALTVVMVTLYEYVNYVKFLFVFFCVGTLWIVQS